MQFVQIGTRRTTTTASTAASAAVSGGVRRASTFELEPDVFWHAYQLRACRFDPDQRVKADRVGRHELVELEDRRLVRRARFEQFRDFPPGEPAREMHDHAVVLASHQNPTVHGRPGGKKRSSDLRPFTRTGRLRAHIGS